MLKELFEKMVEDTTIKRSDKESFYYIEPIVDKDIIFKKITDKELKYFRNFSCTDAYEIGKDDSLFDAVLNSEGKQNKLLLGTASYSFSVPTKKKYLIFNKVDSELIENYFKEIEVSTRKYDSIKNPEGLFVISDICTCDDIKFFISYYVRFGEEIELISWSEYCRLIQLYKDTIEKIENQKKEEEKLISNEYLNKLKNEYLK